MTFITKASRHFSDEPIKLSSAMKCLHIADILPTCRRRSAYMSPVSGALAQAYLPAYLAYFLYFVPNKRKKNWMVLLMGTSVHHHLVASRGLREGKWQLDSYLG